MWVIWSWCVIAAWLECFPEKPSWCRIEQVCQGRQKVWSALSGPTDWILRYIKTTFFTTPGLWHQQSNWQTAVLVAQTHPDSVYLTDIVNEVVSWFLPGAGCAVHDAPSWPALGRPTLASEPAQSPDSRHSYHDLEQRNYGLEDGFNAPWYKHWFSLKECTIVEKQYSRLSCLNAWTIGLWNNPHICI